MWGKRITKYSFTVNDNFSVKSISENKNTKITCNTYNPTTVNIVERHYFKWWFLCTYDTYTYTFS